MSIAAVIVTHNRQEKLNLAIDSLLNQSLPVDKIVVVDNQSTDDTLEYLNDKAKSNKELVVIHSDENLGGAGGFYLAIQKAVELGVDWISIADDDATYDSNYMQEMDIIANKNPDIQCFTGTVYEDNEIGLEHRVQIDDFDKLQLSKIPIEKYQSNFELDVATFVGVFIKAELVKDIGLPEKDYFIWYDDIEYSLRIRSKTKIINNLQSKIYHLTDNNSVGANGIDRPLGWKDYYGYRNRWKTMSLHIKNKEVLAKQLRYEYFRYRVGALLKKKGQYSRIAAFHLVNRAFNDFKADRMGKNDRYLP
ncbi:glycosyltransferase [Lactobacillus sp. YT155]|uniref:glycosyltransferase n=1 Tax=Lactobacillus sp. YT155 TaxID=3060955 RepID=UPI00265FC097|nr:glycosyltransferase [Lactobacillus sp. YT155]MDO1605237.1 glycosyltransferase [Lactobacillus sp. YT155]